MGSQVLVAISSPEPSSFVTSGPSAAALPILVVKSKDDIEKILPVLSGAFLTQAGRTGATKLGQKVLGRLSAAKRARAASKAGVVPKGGGSNTLNALRGKPYTEVAQAPVKVTSYKNIPEGLNLPEGYDDWNSFLDSSKQVQDLHTPQVDAGGNLFDYGKGQQSMVSGHSPLPGGASTPDGRTLAGARRKALQAEVENQNLTTNIANQGTLPQQVEPFTAEEIGSVATGGVGVGSYGVQSMQARSQQNAERQRQEQERIQQIGEQARSKAGTGGGQVAVTA